MNATLLILAAGMGSRYGGLKQVEPVGPSGEKVLDYAVFDAIRAGFTRVVFLIRQDFQAAFSEQIGAKYAGRIAVDYAFQSLGDLPAGFSLHPERLKPLGTGHAVWCARNVVREPFAVINADDFYGADAYRRLYDFAKNDISASASGGRAAAVPVFAMVGYPLANTFSDHGAVSRGVCEVGEQGRLVSVTEHAGLTKETTGPGQPITGAELVSMNCWMFSPEIFGPLDALFREFLSVKGKELGAEFYLPTAVSTMIQRNQARVQVLPTNGQWFGLTHAADRKRVEATLSDLVRRGIYPSPLFPDARGSS
jgi:NDP-sugar pyrophosphorylase family protein